MAFKIAEAYVEVTADDTQVKTRVDQIRAELAELGDKTVTVDIGTTEAKAKIDELKVDLEELAVQHPDVKVRLDAEAALAELAAYKAAVDEVNGKTIRTNVDSSSLKKLSDDEKQVSKDTQALGGLFSNLAPFIIPAVQAVGQLSGAFGLLPAAVIGAGTAFGVAKIALDAFKEPLDKLPPSARATVEAVKGLGPAWDAAKTDVQTHLFENLSTVVKKVGGADLPVLRTGLDQMAAAFNQGVKDVGAWLTSTKTIGDLKTIFTNNGIAAQDFMRALQPILGMLRDVATVGSQFLPQLATNFATAAQKAADFVSHARETGQLHQWIQTGIDAVRQLWDTFKNLFEIIVKITQAPPLFGVTFLSALQAVTGLILKLITDMPQLIPIIEAVVVAWKAWQIAQWALNAAMDANPIGLIIIAIAALVVATIEIVKHWQEVKQVLLDVWNALKSAAETVFNAIKQFFTDLDNAIKQNFIDSWNQIKDALNTAWEAIKSLASTVWDAIKQFFSDTWDSIKQTATDVWNSIKDAISSTWDEIKSAIDSAIQAVESALQSAWDSIKSAVTSAWDAIKSAIQSAWDAIKSAVTSAVDSVKSTLSDAWNSAKQTAQTAWNDLVSAVKTAINDLLGVVRAIPGQITSALGDLSGLLVQAGKNIIQGLINGIESMAGAVASAIGNIASQIRGALPFSPAKWGPLSGSGSPDIAGAKIGQMLAGGIHSSVGTVAAASQRMAGAAGVNPSPAGVGARARRGVGPVTVNVTQIAGSPAETGRYVALALRTVG